MWETIRGYLTFTRKERLGVLFLLLLISVLFVLPYFFKPSVGDPDPAAYEKMKAGIQKFESGLKDSTQAANNHRRYGYPEKGFTGNTERTVPAQMFYFDPNQISLDQWQKLGLSERLSKTILRYVEKGGRFRNVADLKKIYGMHQADYERIFPYVRLAMPSKSFSVPYHSYESYDHHPVKKTDSVFHENTTATKAYPYFPRTVKKFSETDINLADSAVWSSLPGIGEKLAFRIIRFREKLGGFYQVEQVAEIFGLSDSSFQKIKPFLRLNTISLHSINLNSATREELQSHPYIRWQMAKAIMDYRLQHGGFRTTGELLQLAQMDAARFEKLKPYLTLGPQEK
jgi:competence protein ComEA